MKTASHLEIRRLAQKITEQLKGQYCHFPLAVDPLVLAHVLDKMLGIYDEPERNIAPNIAVIGSTIELMHPEDNDIFNVQLTLPGEDNPSQGQISALSPMGLALFGTRPAEQINLWIGSRSIRLVVVNITPG